MTTIMRVQQPAFIHVEDGIRLVDLKNEDEKYLNLKSATTRLT